MLEQMLSEGNIRTTLLQSLLSSDEPALCSDSRPILAVHVLPCRRVSALCDAYLIRDGAEVGYGRATLHDAFQMSVVRAVCRTAYEVVPRQRVCRELCVDERVWQALALMRTQVNEIYVPPVRNPDVSVWEGGDLWVAAIALSDAHVSESTASRLLHLERLSARVWCRCWNSVRARACGHRAALRLTLCSEVELRTRHKGAIEFGEDKSVHWVSARCLRIGHRRLDRCVRVMQSVYTPSTNDIFGVGGSLGGAIGSIIEAMRSFENLCLCSQRSRELSQDVVAQLAGYTQSCLIGGDDLDFSAYDTSELHMPSGFLHSTAWNSDQRRNSRSICGAATVHASFCCQMGRDRKYSSTLHVLVRSHPVWTTARHPVDETDSNLDQVTPLSGKLYLDSNYNGNLRHWCLRENVHGCRNSMLRAVSTFQNHNMLSIHLPNQFSTFRGAAPTCVTSLLDSMQDSEALARDSLQNTQVTRLAPTGSMKLTEQTATLCSERRCCLMSSPCPIPAVLCEIAFDGTVQLFRLVDAYQIATPADLGSAREYAQDTGSVTVTTALDMQDLLVETLKQTLPCNKAHCATRTCSD